MEPIPEPVRVMVVCNTNVYFPDNTRPILLTSTEAGQNFDNRNIYKNESYDKNIVHLGYTSTNIENLPRAGIENNICEQNIENIQNVYTNLSVPKKRKLSQDSPLVKSEPGILFI